MNALEAALVSALKGDGTLAGLSGTRVYNTYAPRGVTVPYVLFHHQTGREDNLTQRRTLSFWYTIKAVATTLSEAGTIAERIDVICHDKEDLAVAGWSTAWWMARDTTVRYVVRDEAADPEAHTGAIYYVRLSQG